MNSPTLKEYIVFKKKVDSFFSKEIEQYYTPYILFQTVDDKIFLKEMSDIMDLFEKNISSLEMANILDTLSNLQEKYFKLADNEQNIDKKFSATMRGMAYFFMIESLNEGSSFSNKVIEEIKQKLGNNYLEIIAKIDKTYISLDTRKYVKSNFEPCYFENEDEIIKKYLILKQLQDKQHEYYFNRIQKAIDSIEKEYIIKNGDLFSTHKENALKLKVLIELSNKDFIDINLLSKYYLAGSRNELIKLIGGKAYGLVILNAHQVDIPKTYVISTVKNLTNSNQFPKIEKNIKYAVRSSADIEDGINNSFAGIFESYLDVEYDLIKEYAQKVKESANNSRARSYIEKNGSQQPHMAVIVQEFKEPDFSGVWIGDDESSGMLEWVKGNGEKLVSGKVTPINEIWIDNNSSSEKIKVGGVSIGKKLIELQQKVVQDDMKIADFEWCILDNELVMLQYRPVTKQLLINKNIKITEMNVGNKEILYGIPASRGEAFGKSKFVNKLSDLDKWNEGDILMTGYTDPDWIEIMSKSSGIVAAVGGFLCHTAIIAREFDIPCVTGIGEDSIKRIWDKEYIYLNGDTGEVHIN